MKMSTKINPQDTPSSKEEAMAAIHDNLKALCKSMGYVAVAIPNEAEDMGDGTHCCNPGCPLLIKSPFNHYYCAGSFNTPSTWKGEPDNFGRMIPGPECPCGKTWVEPLKDSWCPPYKFGKSYGGRCTYVGLYSPGRVFGHQGANTSEKTYSLDEGRPIESVDLDSEIPEFYETPGKWYLIDMDGREPIFVRTFNGSTEVYVRQAIPLKKGE